MNPNDPVEVWLDDEQPPAWALVAPVEPEDDPEPIDVLDDDG